jgi:hypothetical protein
VKAVHEITSRAKHLLASREKFLVLEVAPQGANALFLSVDEDRKLIFEKFVKNADFGKFLSSPWRRITQKTWEGEYVFKSHRKVIVSADPRLATTMPIPLDLARERSRTKDEITLAELENLIAQAMAKIFTQCRNEAAKRLGIDDIHTILVGAKTNRFQIDGHAVMNPIGFTGRKLSLLLELTFTSRDMFENLKLFFNSPDDFFFVEAPQAALLSVARSRELPLNLVTESGAGTDLFVFEKADGEHPVLYREAMPWSFHEIFTAIAASLGVTIATATRLYQAHRADAFSPGAARNFKKIIQPAIDALLQEVERAKVRGFVYFDSEHSLPFDLPYNHKGVIFEAIPVNEVLAELDLEVDAVSWNRVAPHDAFRNLAPFLEAYFAKNTSEINQKLRRRLHWLV